MFVGTILWIKTNNFGKSEKNSIIVMRNCENENQWFTLYNNAINGLTEIHFHFLKKYQI